MSLESTWHVGDAQNLFLASPGLAGAVSDTDLDAHTFVGPMECADILVEPATGALVLST